MVPHSSTLAWEIPWMEEPRRLQSMGSLSRTWLSDFTFTFHFHALEKEMATHSSVLAWRIPGTEEPGGLPSMGLHRVGHDWCDLAAAAAAGKSSKPKLSRHQIGRPGDQSFSLTSKWTSWILVKVPFHFPQDDNSSSLWEVMWHENHFSWTLHFPKWKTLHTSLPPLPIPPPSLPP